jgi:hypothetical protein
MSYESATNILSLTQSLVGPAGNSPISEDNTPPLTIVEFKGGFSPLQGSSKVSFYNVDERFGLPSRKKFDSVIVERFSAPGSFEASSRGGLDPIAEEMSPYNALPFRNLSVRGSNFRRISKTGVLLSFLQDGAHMYAGFFAYLTGTSGPPIAYLFDTSVTSGDKSGGALVRRTDVRAETGRENTAAEFAKAVNSANGNNVGVENSNVKVTILGGGNLLLEGVLSYTDDLTPARLTVTDPFVIQNVEISASIWSTASFGLSRVLSRHTAFGGYDYQAASSASFHKTYRNRLRRNELVSNNTQMKPDGTRMTDTDGGLLGVSVFTSEDFDNAYITRMIPRTENQYSWINKSTTNFNTALNKFYYQNDPSAIIPFIGYLPPSGKISSSLGGFASPTMFLSESEHRSYMEPATLRRRYGITQAAIDDDAALTGGLAVNFVGMNANFLGQVDLSSSTNADSSGMLLTTVLNSASNGTGSLIYDYTSMTTEGRAGAPAALNAQNLRLNGPYGFSTFRQVRGEYHPLARKLKENNLFSISVFHNPIAPVGFEIDVFPKINRSKQTDKFISYQQLMGLNHYTTYGTKIVENYIEPPLTSKFKPMRHEVNVITDEKDIAPLSIQHTYTNNYSSFANNNLLNRIDLAGELNPPGLQVYDNLLELTVKGTVPTDSNPIKGFRHLIYKETMFPKEKHTYLAKTRGRASYDDQIVSEITSTLGTQRSFWKDGLPNRQRSVYQDTTDSSGVSSNCRNPFELFTQELQLEGASLNSLAGETTAASIWPLDTGDRVDLPNSGSSNLQPFQMLTGSKHGELSVIDNRYVGLLGFGLSGYYTNLFIPHLSYEYHNIISFTGSGLASPYVSDLIPDWNTAKYSNNRPWFDSYEEYAQDIRSFGQDYSVIPEFRMSKHMQYYLLNEDFSGVNNFLSIEGGHLSESAPSEEAPFDNDFFDIYSHTDFLKHFDVIHEQHDGVAKQSKMTIKCHGVKKLLPYNGFYPVTRTIQLGTLFSQSFGPFLQRSGTLTNGNKDTFGHIATVSAVMQPLMNPGILYNTIKSGIACDWLAYTASAVTPATTTGEIWNTITNDTTFRLPFETLANPENYLPSSDQSSSAAPSNRIFYTDTYMPFLYNVSQPVPDGSGGFLDQFDGTHTHAIWTGENFPMYSLAMNNFLAEIPSFFLRNERLSRIESLTEASFVSGTTYFMDLELYKSSGSIIYEGHGQTGVRPLTGTFAGGHEYYFNSGTYQDPAYRDFIQVRGIHYGPMMRVSSSMGNAGNRYDPSTAAYTPPYFFGKSIARFRFAPHEFVDLNPGDTIKVGPGEADYDISEVVSHIATSPSGTIFFNDYTLDASGLLKVGLLDSALLTAKDNTHEGALATKHQMTLASSMNLFNIAQKPDLLKNKDGEIVSTSEIKKNRWVITPKFECPTLDFSENPLDSTLPEAPRGMWRGYTNNQKGNKGVFYNIKDSFPATDGFVTNLGNPVIGLPGATNTIGSLKDKLFGNRVPQRVGNVASQKEISEAVVAIPFRMNGNKKVFFPFVPASDAVVAKQVGRDVVEALLGNQEPLDETVFKPGQSLIDQVNKMQKYVFPPQFDFINRKQLSPMHMYIFEFNHILDKEDLINIWQGMMPKIAQKAEKQVSSITHFLTNNELLLGTRITKDIRWMVFKVKKKAAYNFNEMRRRSVYGESYKYDTDADFILENQDTGTGPYSYNWPYDFFSLVELAKIDTGVQIGGGIPITPPDITIDPAPEINDPPKKKDPDLAKDNSMSPSDAKEIFLDPGNVDTAGQTDQEQDAKMHDIGTDPII